MKKHLLIITVLISSINIFSQNCNAYFSSEIVQQNLVQFTDYSLNSDSLQAISWFWDFGDSSISTGQNPMYNYSDTTQNYYVCLTAFFNDSCSSIYCDSVYFIDYTPIDSCNIYLTYTKTDVTTYGANDGSIDLSVFDYYDDVSFIWNTGQTIEDIYNLTAGTYNVTITDSLGCEIDTSITIIEPQLVLSLSGNVYAKTALLPEGIAVLAKKDQAEYTAIDYTQITNGYYIFNNLDTAEYIVYAVPYFGIDVNYFPIYFPTYTGNEMHYENAETIYVDSIQTKNINLEYNETINHGNAYLQGKVIYDYNSNFETEIYNKNWFGTTKTTYEGVAQNIPVFLKTTNGETIKYDLTDNNGEFKINDIPYGQYIVYTENAGRNTESFNVILTQENDSSINNLIHIKSSEIISVNKITNNTINVYPNPFNEYLVIDTKISNIEILDVSGKIVIFEDNIQNNTINTSKLQNGIYFLRATNHNGKRFSKKIIKINN